MTFLTTFLAALTYLVLLIGGCVGIIWGTYALLNGVTEWAVPIGCAVALIVLTAFAYACSEQMERERANALDADPEEE